jgi:hypothetical protein
MGCRMFVVIVPYRAYGPRKISTNYLACNDGGKYASMLSASFIPRLKCIAVSEDTNAAAWETLLSIVDTICQTS